MRKLATMFSLWLVLCSISLIEEFRGYFFQPLGATTAHSLSYGRAEERQGEEKEAEIVNRNLADRALVLCPKNFCK